MRDYLLLRLQGPMQAWGQPTFEGLRTCAPFPTRSGLIGLLAACLGISRDRDDELTQLSTSVRFAVRCDQRQGFKPTILTDFHTVKDSRVNYSGHESHNTIITRREYLCDAHFTLAVWAQSVENKILDILETAVKHPIYTPYLGRRSCPLTAPLWITRVESTNISTAFELADPGTGVIYSEEQSSANDLVYHSRDLPIFDLPRQFSAHQWFIINEEPTHVS